MPTNENLTVHLKVKDYAIWRSGYDGREKSRVSAGITNGRVFRRAEDQNDVVILHDVADVRTFSTNAKLFNSNGASSWRFLALRRRRGRSRPARRLSIGVLMNYAVDDPPAQARLGEFLYGACNKWVGPMGAPAN